MLESMIVELNAGEALPTLSRKGWERVGSDGNAPFNLCEKIAKRMKAGDALISSSFINLAKEDLRLPSSLMAT